MNSTNNTESNNNKVISREKIKIISVNVILKNQRKASLLNIINQQNPDIILISETKLNKNIY